MPTALPGSSSVVSVTNTGQLQTGVAATATALTLAGATTVTGDMSVTGAGNFDMTGTTGSVIFSDLGKWEYGNAFAYNIPLSKGQEDNNSSWLYDAFNDVWDNAFTSGSPSQRITFPIDVLPGSRIRS